MPRPLAALALAGLTLCAAGCGDASNNEGKIGGRWKVVSAGDADPESQQVVARLGKGGAYYYFEFKPGHGFDLGIGADNKKTLDIINAASKDGPTVFRAKYMLLPGDGIEFYELPTKIEGPIISRSGERHRATVRIDGDDMTLIDAAGTNMLKRLK